MNPFVLPKHLEKFAGPSIPLPAKLMTAKGTAPLKPQDLVTCVYAMTLDADSSVVETARKTLAEFPESIMKTALEGGLAAPVLDGIARISRNEEILEVVALKTEIHDETLCFLAEKGSTRVIDIISNNQIRLLKCPAILDALGHNPLTGGAIIDRIYSFLDREGVINTKSASSEPEVSVEEFAAQLEHYDLPEDFDFPEELMEDLKEDIPDEEKAKNLFAQIINMSIMQKIKLGIKGNKEARTILIRDPNKLVSSAVINSPKIGDNEIVAIVGSRTVGDHILRRIYRKKEWRRIYKVQLGLASNPKTPFDIAVQMLKMLRVNDLAGLAKSRSVPNSVRTTAKRMLDTKRR
jgi:hypothetical protein